MPELKNRKRETFCQEYMTDLNASAAARRAGYSPKTADVQGRQMIAMPEIGARIAELMAERSRKTSITAERVIEELAKVGFATMRHFIHVDSDGQPRIDMSETPDDALDALSEIQTETVLEGPAEAEQIVRKSKIKLHDKLAALKLLGEHTGAFKTPAGEAVDGLVEVLKAINARGSAAPISEE